VDATFEGIIRVRRYLCHLCQRTVSLLPEFALPWLRFSIPVIALFLVARLLQGLTLAAAARAASLAAMPYQRGQFWIRRFQKQAPWLSVSLAPLAKPVEAADFVCRAAGMLESIGWIVAHRFLFAELRAHPRPHRAYLALRSKCRSQQSHRMQKLQPLAFVPVSAPPGTFFMPRAFTKKGFTPCCSSTS
jgi:hypothetical protein